MSNLIHPREGETIESVSRRCEAFYECPKVDGRRVGKMVAYNGKSSNGKNLIGDVYFNFAMIEPHLAVVDMYAKLLKEKIIERGRWDIIDTICGVPNGGRTLGQSLALRGSKRFVYADKKPLHRVPGQKQEYEWDLSRFQFKRNENVAVIEDVLNNFQNTEKTLCQIGKTGAHVVLIACALNRSPNSVRTYNARSIFGYDVPIVAVIEKPYPEYNQDDPEVIGDVTGGNVEFDVKANWSALMESMERYKT